MKEAGKPYSRPFEDRTLPDLPANPAWQDVLRRAFLANGDLEAAYFDWKAALLPHYDTAKKMLGAVTSPFVVKTDELLKEVADEMGRGHTFHHATVGVYFGERPIDPAYLVVLAPGIVVALLRAQEFIPGEQHRHALGQQ